MLFGIDRLLAEPELRAPLKGRRVALLAHPASVTADLVHSLDALAAREKDRLVVLTVSQDMQDLDKIAPFFAEKGFKNLQPYTDQENNLGFSYQTGVMPTTVLYDAQGKEVWRMIGGMDWNGTRASALMEGTLAAKD